MSRAFQRASRLPPYLPYSLTFPPPTEASVEPKLALDQESLFFDGASDIFSMYLEMIRDEDKKTAEGWKADADGILIFTGLFSAAVASLISISVQDIRPNPQDTSNFYLANIYRTVDSNRSDISSTFPSVPPTFSPPKYAVVVNLLWFMSLIISLTCALLATLLQQWAWKYIKVTQPRFSPHKRAQIHAYFAEGVETLQLPWVVQALPALLHISLFLFLAGVVVFLCNVNHTIFNLVLPWACICGVSYGCITFMPIFRHDSPYYTPLSSFVWLIVNGIRFVVLRVFRQLVVSKQPGELEKRCRLSLLQGMQKTIDRTAQHSSRVDSRVFMRTFGSLQNDDDLQRFYMGVPGFRNSKVVADPLPGLDKSEKWSLFKELIELMDRTFSSDSLTNEVKKERSVCANAINPADIPGAFQWILDRILTDGYNGLKTAEFGHIVRRWGHDTNKRTGVTVQTIVSVILVRAQNRDDSWFDLATEHLGISKSVLQDYGGHSVSLANLTHITRRLFILLGEEIPLSFGPIVLEAISKFNVQDTSLDLQHGFCDLWNQIVARGGPFDAEEILKYIRKTYVALHEGTDSAPTAFNKFTRDSDWVLAMLPSYPSCKIHDHRPDWTSPHTDVLLLKNHTSASISIHVVHPTTVEDHYLPATSPDQAAANGTQGTTDTPASTTSHPTPEIPAPTPSLASTASPQHNADLCTSSNDPSPPIPGSEHILTDLPSNAVPVTHPSMLTTTPPATTPPGSPQPTSVPDFVAAAENGGSAMAILSKDQDIFSALDESPEHTAPSPHPGNTKGSKKKKKPREHRGDRRSSTTVADTTVAGSSPRSLDADMANMT